MKQLCFEQYGLDFENRLAVRMVEKPQARPGCAVVKVASAGINPVDWKVRTKPVGTVTDCALLQAEIATRCRVIQGCVLV